MLLVTIPVSSNLFCNGSVMSPDTTTVLKELEVVSRVESKEVKATMPLQIMTQGEISQLGIADMADAVKRFSGVNVRDYGGVGGLKTVSVRNMGAAHTAVSYDGLPVDNIEGGQVDIGRFSLNNISKLSLAVGQENDLLQCARLYSSAAVLSIDSRLPEFMNDRAYSVDAKIKGGSWGYLNPYLKVAYKISDKFSVMADGDYTRSNGDYPYVIHNGDEVLHERRNNSKVSNYHAELNFIADLSKNHKISAKGYFYNSKRGVPGSVTLYNPISNETLWGRDAFAQVRYKGVLSSKWVLQVQGKYANGWSRERDQGKQYAGGLWQAEFTQNEYFASASTSFRPNGKFSFAFAQDVMYNTLSYTKSECPFPSRVSSFTALTGKFKIETLEISANVNAVVTSERVKTGKAPDSFKRLNPSVGISWQPLKDVEWYVRGMYKKTDRLPTFNDLYYDRLGTRTLRPEKADEYNLGFTWMKGFDGVLEYCSLLADGYYNYVDDKIVAMPSTHNWRMMNYGKVEIAGVDINAYASFRLGKKMHLNFSGNYSFQYTSDITDAKSSNYKSQLPYSPQHTGNGSLIFDSPWVQIGYSLGAVGKCYYMPQNIKANILDGYVDQSISASHEFSLRDCRLGIKGEILNLANANYEVIKYYPMPGRSFRITLNFKL